MRLDLAAICGQRSVLRCARGRGQAQEFREFQQRGFFAFGHAFNKGTRGAVDLFGEFQAQQMTRILRAFHRQRAGDGGADGGDGEGFEAGAGFRFVGGDGVEQADVSGIQQGDEFKRVVILSVECFGDEADQGLVVGP